MALIESDTLKKYILLLILIISIFFRFWQLNSIPPGLYPDEAINGNEALETLRTGDFKLFYPENNGREGLFIWLVAISFSIFKTSIWSLKFISAAIGVLTVLGLYLLTKELFSQISQNPKTPTIIALLSSFFLSISFWHTNFSRIAFRAILTPFSLVFSFYFFLKGFRTQKIWNLIMGGIFFGLGFYTYGGFRMSVILLVIILIFWWLIFKKQKKEKRFLQFAAYTLFSIALTALPIGIYFIKNPQYFIGRASQVSIFSQPNLLWAFLKSLLLHLGIFNFYGDGNWRHNFSALPQLFWPIGILFLIGFFVSIRKLKNSLQKKNYSSLMIYCLLMGWFFIMLSPGILTYEGIPHALRIIGVIPVAYIFAGLGGWQIYQWLSQNIKNKNLLVLISVSFLLITGFFQFNKYFIKWASYPETKNAFSSNYVKIGDYLNSLPQETQKIVIVNQSGTPIPWPDGIPVPAQTIMFIENTKYGKIQSLYLLPEEMDKKMPEKINKKPTIIIPMTYDENLFQKLQILFPLGSIEEKNEIFMYRI